MAEIFNDNEGVQQQVLLETAQTAWCELQYFFARNMAIYVSCDLDLVDVATQIAEDNKAAVEKWMRLGEIARVTNEQAKKWHVSDAIVWAVVVKPWVLVQGTGTGAPSKTGTNSKPN